MRRCPHSKPYFGERQRNGSDQTQIPTEQTQFPKAQYQNQETERYGVVIDGGSTGTRIHVFKYEVRKGTMVLDFSEKGLVSVKVNPGLWAYVEEPEGAGAAVAELVEFAKRHVPKEQWRKADIRLMATAGMRLLKTVDQKRILNVCRRVLRKSGFQF